MNCGHKSQNCGHGLGWKSRVAMGALLIGFFGYVTRSITLPMAGRWLDVGEVPQHTDFVMVLNGDSATRPFAAADIFHQGHADKILITSVQPRDRATVKPQVHVEVRMILTKCGVPESKVVLVDSKTRSTFDEAQTLDQFLDGQPATTTVSVVTNEYHSRRTRWVFRRVLGSQMNRVHFLSAKTDSFDATNWWKHENGFVWYLSEYFKFAFYVFRYGHALAWTAAIAVAAGVVWWSRNSTSAKSAPVR